MQAKAGIPLPQAGIPLKQANSNPVEELLGAGGGVMGANPLINGLPNRPNDGDGVLSQATQSLSHNGDKFYPY